MKKAIFSLLILFTVFAAATAQDGVKQYKAAKKALTTYKFNDRTEVDKLNEARDAIDLAVADTEAAAMAKVWQLKGEIYQEITMNELMKIKHPNAVDAAYEGYKKAMELATKKYEKQDAMDGMAGLALSFHDKALVRFDAKDYEGAYNAWNTVLVMKKALDEAGKEDFLATQTDLEEFRYRTAYAAMMAQKNAEAVALFELLQQGDMGNTEASIYTSLFRLTVEDDEEKGLAYLTAGREKFPEDQSLLLNETQYFLDKGRLDEAELRLQQAIEKDPENKVLLTSLGKVYDDLYQQDKNEDFFAKAVKYYEGALAVDENHLAAVYNIGALYFNRTTPLRLKMNELPPSAQKEYDELKTQVDELFGKALPFFTRAEAIDANDLNTLIALKEIYANMGDFQKSNEYKTKLEAAQQK